MQNVIAKNGNYISAVIQALMYYFAGEYIIQQYLSMISPSLEYLVLLLLIILPLVVVKYCETKFASKYISD